jgi:hypothetical protein
VPFADYQELVDRVENHLVRPDLNPEIPDFIRLAEVDLAREFGWRFTETETTGNFVADQDYITLPAGILWPRMLRITDTDPGPYVVDIVSGRKFADIIRQVSSGSRPIGATHVGEQLKLAPAPGKNWAYTLWWTGTITPLDFTSNTTNWMLTNAFDALLYGALQHACDFLGDAASSDRYEMKYEKYKQSAKRMEFRARTGGGTIRVETDIDQGTIPRRV